MNGVPLHRAPRGVTWDLESLWAESGRWWRGVELRGQQQSFPCQANRGLLRMNVLKFLIKFVKFVAYIEGRFKSGHFTHRECVSHVECCSGLWTSKILMYFQRPFDWTLWFWPLLPEIFPRCFKWNLFNLHTRWAPASYKWSYNPYNK